MESQSDSEASDESNHHGENLTVFCCSECLLCCMGEEAFRCHKRGHQAVVVLEYNERLSELTDCNVKLDSGSRGRSTDLSTFTSNSDTDSSSDSSTSSSEDERDSSSESSIDSSSDSSTDSSSDSSIELYNDGGNQDGCVFKAAEDIRLSATTPTITTAAVSKCKVQKDFTCPECNVKFALRSSLSNHKKVHRGASLRSCPLCPAKFRSSKVLKNHKMLVHSTRKQVLGAKGFANITNTTPS